MADTKETRKAVRSAVSSLARAKDGQEDERPARAKLKKTMKEYDK